MTNLERMIRDDPQSAYDPHDPLNRGTREIPMIIRREALKAALHCATADDSRYFLHGVHILPDGTVEATDGSILVRVHDRYAYAVEDFPAVPGVGSPFTPPPANGTIIPADIAKKLIAATAKKSTIPILTAVKVGTVDGHTYAVATDLEAPLVVCLDRVNEEMRFPETDRVLIKDKARTGVIKLTLSAEMLATLAALGREIGWAKSTNAVTLEIPTEAKDRTEDQLHSQIRFTAQGSDLSIEGVVMPCRV
jgi:hypothetical protein